MSMSDEDLKKLAEAMAPAVASQVLKGADRNAVPEVVKPAPEAAPVQKSGAALFARIGVAKALEAKGWTDESQVKALTAGTTSTGGALVVPQYSSEFIDLLRNQSVVRKAGAVQIDMNGRSLTFARMTSGSSANFVGENSADTVSTQAFDQVTLTGHKLIGRTEISNDLLRYAQNAAEVTVQNDLLRKVAAREDLAFLLGTGSSNEPTGIFNAVNASNKFAETSAVAGAATYSEVKKDLYKARALLKKSGATGPAAWFFCPDVERYLLSLSGNGGEGTNSFESEMNSKGTLLGIPYYVSDQIPFNLGSGTDESLVGLFDMSEVLIGDAVPVEIEHFPNSNIANDLSCIRAIESVDIALKHDKAGVVITGVTWGQ